jgi:uncharacterized protein YgiM (DUF1202 family)
MYRLAALVIFLVSVLISVNALAQDYYVQSEQAPLWQLPSFKAEKLAMVPQGEQVKVVEEQQGWVSVLYNKQNGWMLKLMLSTKPPVDSKVSHQQAVELMDDRARLRPSAFASTAAARGLMNKEKGFGENLKVDFKAVEMMESWRVSEKEALYFLKEGKSNEKKN